MNSRQAKAIAIVILHTCALRTTYVHVYAILQFTYTCTMALASTYVRTYVRTYSSTYHGTRVLLSQVSKCPARTTTRGTHRRGLPLRPS